MSIQRPAIFDAYACPIGTFPIAPSAVDAVKNGRFCKINAKGQIVLPAAGDKAWMVVFPNELPKKGFATNLGAFLIGAYACYIDNDTFDDSKTYKVGDPLYCDATGKLTNVKAGNGIVVAYVIKGVKDYAGKKIMKIRSQQKYQVVAS